MSRSIFAYLDKVLAVSVCQLKHSPLLLLCYLHCNYINEQIENIICLLRRKLERYLYLKHM